MQKNGKFLRLSPIDAVALIAVIISLSSGLTSSVTAATSEATEAATMEGTVDVSAFAVCMAPTPTPGGPTATTESPATMVATEAATMEATEVATMAATSASTKPTAKPTATRKPTATKVPPTATKIPIGKQPANAGIVLNVNAAMVRADSSRCVRVASVTAGGPADVAGIKAGNFILGFNQDEIKTAADFYDEVGAHSSGDEVYVTIQSGTDVKTVEVVLGLNPFAK